MLHLPLLFIFFLHALHVYAVSSACPAVPFSTLRLDQGASSVLANHRLFSLLRQPVPPIDAHVTVVAVDVHITTPLGFFNYRMTPTNSTPPAYIFDAPEWMALPPSTEYSYWFTTHAASMDKPVAYACDSEVETTTSPGSATPNIAPAPVPGAVCPALLFTHVLQSTGDNSYAVRFTPIPVALPLAGATSRLVAWVDVHIAAKGGFFNYRMTPTSAGFQHALPTPQLALPPGTAVSYWFTYSVNNTDGSSVQCDTLTANVIAGSNPTNPSICPLVTFTANVQPFRPESDLTVVEFKEVLGPVVTIVMVHITHSSGEYEYVLTKQNRAADEPQYFFQFLPDVLAKPAKNAWTYAFTYTTEASTASCRTDTFTAVV